MTKQEFPELEFKMDRYEEHLEASCSNCGCLIKVGFREGTAVFPNMAPCVECRTFFKIKCQDTFATRLGLMSKNLIPYWTIVCESINSYDQDALKKKLSGIGSITDIATGGFIFETSGRAELPTVPVIMRVDDPRKFLAFTTRLLVDADTAIQMIQKAIIELEGYCGLKLKPHVIIKEEFDKETGIMKVVFKENIGELEVNKSLRPGRESRHWN